MGKECQIKMSQNISKMKNVELMRGKSILKLEYFATILSFNQHLFCELRLKSHFQGTTFAYVMPFIQSRKKWKLKRKASAFSQICR